ncbi:hypothetical protein ANCDUO_21169 [Ancylostoma duodenale]|uniref:SCP domain-containing protein n=1 Tax=Ancylostoma duodenale TaxID=51022 RepID=A0A0C2BXQ4_9BILA|nr:hypothetical protein ANCDUO_21169 [Ancylostoma duodenale]
MTDAGRRKVVELHNTLRHVLCMRLLAFSVSVWVNVARGSIQLSRSYLANGNVINGPYNGHFKKGANIMKMKLVGKHSILMKEYDCELEASADEVARGCEIDEVNQRRLSQTEENLYVFRGSGGGISEVIKRSLVYYDQQDRNTDTINMHETSENF